MARALLTLIALVALTATVVPAPIVTAAENGCGGDFTGADNCNFLAQGSLLVIEVEAWSLGGSTVSLWYTTYFEGTGTIGTCTRTIDPQASPFKQTMTCTLATDIPTGALVTCNVLGNAIGSYTCNSMDPV